MKEEYEDTRSEAVDLAKEFIAGDFEYLPGLSATMILCNAIIEMDEILTNWVDSSNTSDNLIDPSIVVSFAVDRWMEEVSNRPLDNKTRRTLDDSWRQVIRKFGGNPEMLIGPDHDTLVGQSK